MSFLSDAPNFKQDSQGLIDGFANPHVGAEVERLVGSQWLVSFEDLDLGFLQKSGWHGEPDWNDSAWWVCVFADRVVVNFYKGLSAHYHTLSVFDQSDEVVLHLQNNVTRAGYFSGTEQAWAKCLNCEALPRTPSSVPEPSAMLLVGGALVMWGVAKWLNKLIFRFN